MSSLPVAPSLFTKRLQPVFIKWLQRVLQFEWIVALAITVIVVVLDVSYAQHAGGLWRDEANSFAMANYPSLSTTWDRLQFDSFPMLWYLILRGWIGLGLGKTDIEFRVFGLIVNLGIIGILWLNAWRMSRRPPVAALTLLGANAAVMMYCGSVRGYGLGLLFGLWMYGAVWLYLVRPTAVRWAVAVVAAVLACHTLYYNCVFVAAACLGGASVALSERRWRTAASLIALGAVTAATLLIYVPTFRTSGEWRSMYVFPGGLPWLWIKFVEAVDLGHPIMRSIWVAVAVCVALGGFLTWSRTRSALGLYAAVSVVAGVIGNILFLRLLNYYMQPWYFLSLMAVVAAAADAAQHAGSTGRGYRIGGVSLAAAALLAILVAPLYTWSNTRRTNLDEVARVVERSATQGDYIVLTDWTHGITFHRYYHGSAAWQTLTPLPADAHDIHRSDLAFQQLHRADAASPVLDSVVQTLRAGRRVFYIGHLPAHPPTEPPRVYYMRRVQQFPPAPIEMWVYELDYALGQLAGRVTRVPINVGQPVSVYEDLGLYVFEGKRTSSVEP
jgi:hypothetical protein